MHKIRIILNHIKSKNYQTIININSTVSGDKLHTKVPLTYIMSAKFRHFESPLLANLHSPLAESRRTLDSYPVIMPYKVMNRLYTTLQGLFNSSVTVRQVFANEVYDIILKLQQS